MGGAKGAGPTGLETWQTMRRETPRLPQPRPEIGRWIVWALFGVVVVWLLLGCTSGIALRHPDGRVATCGGSVLVGVAMQLRAADRDRDCVADFQRQGFERATR